MRKKNKSGFSLMEMAVVLVVVALVTVAAFAGKQMLDRTKEKSLITDMESVTKAIETFQKTYGALPGDMYNASARLGNFPSGLAVKNGDGDGVLQANNSNGDNEFLILWQHLAVAGLIPGEYDGTTNKPGVGIPLSKYGNNIGMELEQTGNAINVKFSRYDSAGTGDQGFLTPKETYELACRYGDCAGTGGLVKVSPNCISGGSINVSSNNRDCYVEFQSTALTSGATAAPVTTASAAPTAAATKCPDGTAVGATVTRNCTDFNPDMGGTYELICRDSGIMEVNPDPSSYHCTSADCSNKSVIDSKGHNEAYNQTNVGAWRRGDCGTGTWLAGYRPSDNSLDDTYFTNATLTSLNQSAVSYPQLQCKPPGGDSGWNLVNGGQSITGYCDVYCDYSQMKNNGPYGSSYPNAAYVIGDGQDKTAYTNVQKTQKNESINVICAAGYSDISKAEGAEWQLLLCQPTAGAGYATLTLNCLSDCNTNSISGWNATRMSATGGWSGNSSPYVRRTTSTTLSCNAGYTGAATSPSCTAGGVWSGVAPTCLQNCAAASLSCGNGANCSFPGGTTSGTTQTVTCPAGYTGSVQSTCNDGSWSAVSGTCYQNCGATPHGGTASCSPGGCSCGVDSNGTKTCNNGSWGGCVGGACSDCGGGGCVSANCGGTVVCLDYCGGSWKCPVWCSDRRLKENITWTGIKNGINIYRFNYIGSEIIYEGVIAQEVTSIPGVVIFDSPQCAGYMAVNYGQLGIKFRRIE